MKMKIRIDNLELLPHDTKDEDFQIVRWNGSTNYVLAFLRRHDEGYDLRTVSGRPFKEPYFWVFAQLCYEALMLVWNFTKEEG